MPDIAQLNTAHPRIRQVFSYWRTWHRFAFLPVAGPMRTRGHFLFHPYHGTHLCRLRVVTFPGNGDGLPGESEIPPPQGSVPPGEQDGLVTIKRPTLTGPPALPPSLTDWILPGWETIPGKVEVRKSSNVTGKDGKTQIVSFRADPDRVAVFNRWKAKRSEWEVMSARHGKRWSSSRDLRPPWDTTAGGRKIRTGSRRRHPELGIAGWRDTSPRPVPAGTARVRPGMPSFIVREPDTPPELYTALLRFLPGVDGTAINDAQKELITGSYHPLEKRATDGFLTRLVTRLSPKGEFAGRLTGHWRETLPTYITAPQSSLMRARALGYNNAIDAILEDIKSKECLPDSLTTATKGKCHRRLWTMTDAEVA